MPDRGPTMPSEDMPTDRRRVWVLPMTERPGAKTYWLSRNHDSSRALDIDSRSKDPIGRTLSGKVLRAVDAPEQTIEERCAHDPPDSDAAGGRKEYLWVTAALETPGAARELRQYDGFTSQEEKGRPPSAGYEARAAAALTTMLTMAREERLHPSLEEVLTPEGWQKWRDSEREITREGPQLPKVKGDDDPGGGGPPPAVLQRQLPAQRPEQLPPEMENPRIPDRTWR